SITDFAKSGTRELTADDYVYAFRRLASPRVISPIYGVMAEHVVGMRDYGEALKKDDRERQSQGVAGDGTWLDLRQHGFDGVQAVDAPTLRIKVIGEYRQLK